jgi:hypothetical protein
MLRFSSPLCSLLQSYISSLLRMMPSLFGGASRVLLAVGRRFPSVIAASPPSFLGLLVVRAPALVGAGPALDLVSAAGVPGLLAFLPGMPVSLLPVFSGSRAVPHTNLIGGSRCGAGHEIWRNAISAYRGLGNNSDNSDLLVMVAQIWVL